jgi:hypothetical protein
MLKAAEEFLAASGVCTPVLPPPFRTGTVTHPFAALGKSAVTLLCDAVTHSIARMISLYAHPQKQCRRSVPLFPMPIDNDGRESSCAGQQATHPVPHGLAPRASSTRWISVRFSFVRIEVGVHPSARSFSLFRRSLVGQRSSASTGILTDAPILRAGNSPLRTSS